MMKILVTLTYLQLTNCSMIKHFKILVMERLEQRRSKVKTRPNRSLNANTYKTWNLKILIYLSIHIVHLS